QELTRVLRPGGHMIASVDTRWQLRHFLDPYLNPLLHPLLSPLLSGMRRAMGQQRGLRRPVVRSYVTSLRAFRHALEQNGCRELRGTALGFGPFTVFKRELFPGAVGLKVHKRLQRLADRGAPILRSTRSQYLVLA